MIMNHRVALLKRVVGRNAANEPISDWSPLAATWANVRFQTGAEVMRAGADTSVVRVSIRIRARTDVDTEMRVRYKDVQYDIKSALPDTSDNQFMFLVCESVP